MVSSKFDAIPDLVDWALPAVVQINVSDQGKESNGSGFVVRSSEGKSLVLTNGHVVHKDASHTAWFMDDTEVNATVVGRHPIIDIALLEANHEASHKLELRTDEPIRVGEPVIAIGSPLGLRGSVTAGIVSALDRPRVGPDGIPQTMIQTDAALIWGNSGGPLVAMDGRVVGVSSQIELRQDGPSPGISYAIPGTSASLALKVIIDSPKDRIPRPHLGARLEEHRLDRPVSELVGQLRGASISSRPRKGLPAARAGLRFGDIIVRLEGQKVDDPGDIFTWLLDPDCLKRDAAIEFVRDGKIKRTTVRPETDGHEGKAK